MIPVTSYGLMFKWFVIGWDLVALLLQCKKMADQQGWLPKPDHLSDLGSDIPSNSVFDTNMLTDLDGE